VHDISIRVFNKQNYEVVQKIPFISFLSMTYMQHRSLCRRARGWWKARMSYAL